MILYQYRGPIRTGEQFQYLLDLMSHGAMKFSRPSEFNDPFDCCPTHFNELPLGALPHAVTSELNQYMRHVTSHVAGICCLTPYPDRMLMWSHYGDQHRSVCVGFDTTVLLEQCAKNDEGNPIYEEIVKIKYTNFRPNEGDGEAFHKKSEEWRYEDEYRIVSYAKKGNPQWGPGVWNIPPSAIREIVIGARVDRQLQEQIARSATAMRPDIQLRKAVLHTHTFELVIENLSDQPNVAPMSGVLLGPNGNWINV
jgi:hypothetical protein